MCATSNKIKKDIPTYEETQRFELILQLESRKKKLNRTGMLQDYLSVDGQRKLFNWLRRKRKRPFKKWTSWIREAKDRQRNGGL